MAIGMERKEINTLYEREYADSLKSEAKYIKAVWRVFMNSKVLIPSMQKRLPNKP
jgi:hypothetical protein